MLISGIKSRPIYPGLVLDPDAKRHVIAAEGEGALAVLDLLRPAPAEILGRTTLIYTAGASVAQNHAQSLAALNTSDLFQLPSVPTALTRLAGVLATAKMGTRLYATGTEGFIGQVVALALEHGINHHSIPTEHRGSLARRVQCVHCKGMTETVTTSIYVCSHCGLNLLVRDHYSRRLGAFQGVCIDAEVPGDVPPAEEIFR